MLSGYKTVIVNVVVILAMVLTMFNPDAEVPTGESAGALVDQLDAMLVAGLAFVNLILRAVTTSPIFKPKTE